MLYRNSAYDALHRQAAARGRRGGGGGHALPSSCFNLEICAENCIMRRAVAAGKPLRMHEIHAKRGDGEDLTLIVTVDAARRRAGARDLPRRDGRVARAAQVSRAARRASAAPRRSSSARCSSAPRRSGARRTSSCSTRRCRRSGGWSPASRTSSTTRSTSSTATSTSWRSTSASSSTWSSSTKRASCPTRSGARAAELQATASTSTSCMRGLGAPAQERARGRRAHRADRRRAQDVLAAAGGQGRGDRSGGRARDHAAPVAAAAARSRDGAPAVRADCRACAAAAARCSRCS